VCTGHQLAIVYKLSTGTSTYFKFYNENITGALKVLFTLALVLLCLVTGFKTSPHFFFNQSEVKPKPIATDSNTFSYALLHHDNLDFGFMTSN